jgi:hypothetical protein
MTINLPIEKTGYQILNKKPGGFRPTWIVIHHSFSTDRQTRNWDSIRAYHMSYRCKGDTISRVEYDRLLAEGKTAGLERPWTDIGYNLGVENVSGRLEVLPGRPIGEIGAHAHGFNDRSVGICIVGNYDLDPPDDDRLAFLASLCRQIQIEFGIPRDQVIGHRETYGKLTPPQPVAKTCPGSQFDLDAFRARLRA